MREAVMSGVQTPESFQPSTTANQGSLPDECLNAPLPSSPHVLTLASVTKSTGSTSGVPHAFAPNLQSSYQMSVDIPPLQQLGPMSATVKALSSSTTYSIALAGGFELHYSEGDLQQPTSVQGLISRPDELYSFWDDTSPTWDKDKCPLVVRGVSIALKYWDKFYCNFERKDVWEELKQNWNNFKVRTQSLLYPSLTICFLRY